MAGFWGLLRENADSVCHHERRQRKHMAKIRDTKGRDEGGSGYVRLLGNEELGVLLSKTHATVIRNGNELEHLIAERCPFRCSGLEQRLAVGPVEILGGGGRPSTKFQTIRPEGTAHMVAICTPYLSAASRNSFASSTLFIAGQFT
jgi:hypothetical protein